MSSSILRRLFALAFLSQTIIVSSVYASDAINSNINWKAFPPVYSSNVLLDGRRADVNGGEWYTMDSSDIVEFDLQTTVGYRLTDDPSNAVVLKSGIWDTPISAEFYGNQGDVPHVRNNVNIGGVVFTNSSNPNPSGVDVWNTTAPYQEIPLVIEFRTDNQYCADTKTLTVYTRDGNGVTENFTGIDTVSGTIAGPLPVQVNVTFAESPEYNAVITYNPTNSLQYVLGDGPVKPFVPAAAIVTTFFLCH